MQRMLTASSRRFATGWLMLFLVVSGACMQGSFQSAQRHYRQGEYDRALEAYDQFLAAAPASATKSSEALYRMALIHADERGGAYDPERSVSFFRQLCDDYPGSRECSISSLIRGLQVEIRRLTALFAEEEAFNQSMTTTLSRSRLQVDELEGALEGRQKEAGDLDERIASLTAQLRATKNQLQEKRERVNELEEALEKLKRIALESPPR